MNATKNDRLTALVQSELIERRTCKQYAERYKGVGKASMVILINCRIEILYVRSWNEISKNPRFFRMNLVYEDTPRKEIQEFFERKVEIENLRNRNEPTIPSLLEVEKKKFKMSSK